MSERHLFLPIEDMVPTFVFQCLSELNDWGSVASGVPDAHKFTKGAGIKIAVLDTGEPNHEDLNANLLPAHNCAGTQTATDFCGHGSHVAGIIAACQNDQGIIGIAPEAKIVPVKVLDDSGHSGFDSIEAGIRAAITAGVDIINMSLGCPVEPPQSLHDAIKEAANSGIILVAAAGNDKGAVNWPARYDEVIAVAAVDQSGNMAKFSSRGPQVDIGAPGVNVYSTWLNNKYASLNGTSQACPFIAGVCALILSWVRSNPSVPQVTGIKDMLNRLEDISDNKGRVAQTANGLGYGIPRFGNVNWKI